MTARREGFTFVELLLVLIIGMMLLGGAYKTLLQQELAYAQLNAMAATQEDARTGIELLTAELRELSTAGGDLLMATPDSLRFRSLRKFGVVCFIDGGGKKLIVQQLGADPFVRYDSVYVFEDVDTLRASDDNWEREFINGVSAGGSCPNTLGASIATLFPGGTMRTLTLQGSGLKFDSVFPGAPIRSFRHVAYRTLAMDGQMMLMMKDQTGAMTPLVGPLDGTAGLKFAYFDTLGAPLTTFPLDAAARAAVRRIRVEVKAVRRTGAPTETHRDSLVTDIFTRGS